MPNTRQVKQRIKTAKNISKITKAMEMVAASKMRKAQERALSARDYTQALSQSLTTLAKNINDQEIHPLLKQNSNGKPLAIIIGTDKGLCGSLNQSLFKLLLNWLKGRSHGQVVAVGKTMTRMAYFYGLNLKAQFTSLPDAVTTTDIVGLSRLIIDGYAAENFRSVELFFMDFVNTLSQKPKQFTLLPLAQNLKEKQTIAQAGVQAQYIFEPSASEILNDLLPFYVENMIYQAFLESRASEHSARMVTMKNASENATELVGDLKLIYNKQRQASITNELLDITTATMSLNS